MHCVYSLIIFSHFNLFQMKKLSSIAIVATILLIACQNPSSAKVEAKNILPDSTSYNGSSNKDVTASLEKDTLVKEVLQAYLDLKNSLAADKSKEASTSGEKLLSALNTFPVSSLSTAQQTEVNEIVTDAKEHAEHIGENAGNIKHQREHFQELSNDMYDLLKLVGTSQTVYKDSCPMVKAIWISEKKEIVNPYYGKDMLTCGKVLETIER